MFGMRGGILHFKPLKANSHTKCSAHACQCRVARGLEFVFPIWFTPCGYVWFTLAMLMPMPLLRKCHSPTMPF